MKKIKHIWNGGGYLYDDGDVPECSYCNTDAHSTDIYASAHSGVLLCEDQECMNSYMNEQIMDGRLEHSTETIEVCDGCEEEYDNCWCETEEENDK